MSSPNQVIERTSQLVDRGARMGTRRIRRGRTALDEEIDRSSPLQCRRR